MNINITPNDIDNYSHWFVRQFSRRRPRFGIFNGLALSFAALATQQHRWNYLITPALPTFGLLSNQPDVSASLARILVETGIAVTPAGSPLNDFRAGFAVVRYSEFFRALQRLPNNPLLITSPSASISSRLKQIMAEEISAGIACFFLREYLDVVQVIDYQVWQRNLNRPIVGRFPDYYCLTTDREALLVEVKGTITKRLTTMNGVRSEGAEQVRNGVFGSERPRSLCNRFVIATNLLFSPSLVPSMTYIDQIIDNAEVTGSDEFSDFKPTDFDSRVAPEVLAQCKILRYFGLDQFAVNLLAGKKPFSGYENLLQRENSTVIFDSEFVAIGSDPLNNILLFDKEALQYPRNGPEKKSKIMSMKAKKAAARTPKDKLAFHLSDELVVCPNPNFISSNFKNDR